MSANAAAKGVASKLAQSIEVPQTHRMLANVGGGPLGANRQSAHIPTKDHEGMQQMSPKYEPLNK